MKFEKLNYSDGNVKKAFIIGFLVCALIFIIINLFLTKAKYQVTESIPLASGTINYNGYDFKIMAMYIVDGSKETPTTKMPGSNYVIIENRSYCTIDNKNHDPNAILKTINGNHTIANLSKNEKCYLYFEEKITTGADTFAKLKQDLMGDVGSITGPACSNSKNCTMKDSGVYKTQDDFGDSYVYRGTVDNNWVKFGKGQNKENGDIWWRIIRINGNGTIRLIYAGTSTTSSAPSTSGMSTMIPLTSFSGREDYPRAWFLIESLLIVHIIVMIINMLDICIIIVPRHLIVLTMLIR